MKTYVHGLTIEPYKVKEDTVAKCLQAIKDHYIEQELKSIAESRTELANAELLDSSDKEMHISIIEECEEILGSIQAAKSMASLETVLQTVYDCNIHIVEEKFNSVK
jgi:histidyl-tRNA synthetase